ncbi:bifunctional acetate--CoA ligase family protein/GNAT family N-acetyltransferase [Wenzhouxiangella sp. EGI_FJ10305]|uniref:bifunctional acetate--CoA ligase family protein/GNAT family N-acetyltransferase n=1 Tax=Wenzhouxiangella sp. EGI_FJ10305 TaxID=3243768 RepID=UPI0035D824BE
MSIRHLDRMFKPRSIAVFGASDRPGSVGRAVFNNLVDGDFEGSLFPINLRHREVAGRKVYRKAKDLPEVPDLGVICTPPETAPGIIEDLGVLGTRAAVVVTAGFDEAGEDSGRDLKGELLENAGRHGLRFLGPNCVGLMVPGHGLNASFAPGKPLPGRIAFLTQSGALATTVLDWAAERDIGFSAFVSLGNCLDVDVGDVIDYLGSDGHTRSILLYMEALGDGRKFMSAARAASRNKPLVVVKSGRAPEGARAAASHTGALAGRDEVYAAAIRRAGALRVYGIDDLFRAAEFLARVPPQEGNRLAILTNGGGPGILATDELVLKGGTLAELEEATVEQLDGVLPRNWSRGNPVDIIGDASGERYGKALEILVGADEVDAVLIVHAPTALAGSRAVAAELAPIAAAASKPVFGCWLGGASAREAYEEFAAADLPGFLSPDDAIAAFLALQEYRANQVALMEIPSEMPTSARMDPDSVSVILERAYRERRTWLSEVEAKCLLSAYGIPAVETRRAESSEEAARLAAEIGFPVALKVISADITHKSDVGGVMLDLESEQAVQEAAEGIARRVERLAHAKLEGFSVQQMVRRADSVELIIGASTDPVFGPVMLFGSGGTAVEVVGDTVVGLPPLNMSLARQMVDRTRVAKLLAGYRNRPAARADLVCDVLVRAARLMTDLEGIESIDINPLLADDEGVVAVDARVELRSAGAGPRKRPAIAPYPTHLVENVPFGDGEITIRPIRPEDEPAHRDFFYSLEAEDVRFRFFGVIREPQHSQLARFTQIDYEREMAFIAVDDDGRTLGVARIALDSLGHRAEFAVVVRSNIKGRGLGRILLSRLIRHCRETGVEEVVGQVLQQNTRMLALARDLGFRIEAADDDGIHDVILDLAQDNED